MRVQNIVLDQERVEAESHCEIRELEEVEAHGAEKVHVEMDHGVLDHEGVVVEAHVELLLVALLKVQKDDFQYAPIH